MPEPDASPLPVLWTFRRCPYAMRARLAIASAGIPVALREIVLREKPEAFLAASPKGTVPVVVDGGTVIEESRDVMAWALAQNDPERWLDMPGAGNALIDEADGPFKRALDRTKYAVRYPDVDIDEERAKAGGFLMRLNTQLGGNQFLFGDAPRLADMAILPFVRQFAHTDLDWFNAQPWTATARWLETFKASARFHAIMNKYPQWQPGDATTSFPVAA
ncbi:MAG: glutathione S-transferase [Pseudomonadota bacterium]